MYKSLGSNFPTGPLALNTDSPQYARLLHAFPLMGEEAGNANQAVDLTGRSRPAVFQSARLQNVIAGGTDKDTAILAPTAYSHDPFFDQSLKGTGVKIGGKKGFTLSVWFRYIGGFNRCVLEIGSVQDVMKRVYVYVPSGTQLSMGFWSYDIGLTVPDMGNRWVHAAFSYNGDTNKLRAYYNGAFQSERDIEAGGPTVDETFALFNYIGNFGGGNLWGQVADFRLYEGVLADADVARLFNPGTRFDLYRSAYDEPMYIGSSAPAQEVGEATLAGTVTGTGAAAVSVVGAGAMAGTLAATGAAVVSVPAAGTWEGTTTGTGGGAVSIAGAAALAGAVDASGELTVSQVGVATFAASVAAAGAATATVVGEALFVGTVTSAGAGETTVYGTLTMAGTAAGTGQGVSAVRGVASFAGAVTGAGVAMVAVRGTATWAGVTHALWVIGSLNSYFADYGEVEITPLFTVDEADPVNPTVDGLDIPEGSITDVEVPEPANAGADVYNQSSGEADVFGVLSAEEGDAVLPITLVIEFKINK